uniref:Photosystem II D1 processing protein PSB27-H2, chloroplastic n=1 Tax=Aegilops tauschii subsp. strangulata TaxID=200361 RepID=A0A453LSU3_AEGTS
RRRRRRRRSSEPRRASGGLSVTHRRHPSIHPLVLAAPTNSSRAARNSAGGARLLLTRRALAGAMVTVAAAGRARAAEEDGGEGVVGAFKSLFDPNEETKGGKVLPKAYLKAAREVVRTLRESLGEGDAAGDSASFRRGADSAKTSIREFIGGWRGQPAVAREESYVALEKAIKSLAEFYSKAGPFASLPGDVKNKILDDLNARRIWA